MCSFISWLHLATLTSVRRQERKRGLPRDVLEEKKGFKVITSGRVCPDDSNPALKSSMIHNPSSAQTGPKRCHRRLAISTAPGFPVIAWCEGVGGPVCTTHWCSGEIVSLSWAMRRPISTSQLWFHFLHSHPHPSSKHSSHFFILTGAPWVNLPGGWMLFLFHLIGKETKVGNTKRLEGRPSQALRVAPNLPTGLQFTWVQAGFSQHNPTLYLGAGKVFAKNF